MRGSVLGFTLLLGFLGVVPVLGADRTDTITYIPGPPPAYKVTRVGGPLVIVNPNPPPALSKSGNKLTVKNATGGKLIITVTDGGGTKVVDGVTVNNNASVSGPISVLGRVRVCFTPVQNTSAAEEQCYTLEVQVAALPAASTQSMATAFVMLLMGLALRFGRRQVAVA